MKKYFFSKNRCRTVALLFFACLKTIGMVGVAVILSVQIDAISRAISTGNVKSLTGCAVICFIYAIVLGLTIFIAERLKGTWIKQTMLSIRQDVFHGIMDKTIPDYNSKNSAEYIALLNQNLGTFEENYFKNAISILESCVSILVAVVLLLYINPIIAVISIMAMAVPSLIPKLYGKKLGERQGNIMKAGATYTAKIKDAFNGYEVLKTYGAEKEAENIQRGSAENLENSKVGMANTMAQLYGITNMASISVQFLIMLLSGVFAVNGIITIGNIIAVTQLTGQVISPAFQLSTKITQLKATKPISEQIKSVTTCEKKHSKTAPFCEMEKTLSVVNLSFSYADTPALNNVNFLFERGKKYAIIGKSGSGKSTLLKLLAGYYEEYAGKILVDGRADVQCDCALIHQNVFLFDDTIRNNITLYGGYSEKEIFSAIHAAGLDDVIQGLPDGLETRVEENGSRFSGGEKQRIAVARAILHRKNVLLVDEATSSLDVENARTVENNLLGLEKITCITVTHQLDSEMAKKYDAVLEMKNGTLKEVRDYENYN